jgi:tRNA(His) 5'-end guanylyltransferase
MNAAAKEVMKDLPELAIAYGVSDEFRYIFRASSRQTTCVLTTHVQLCVPPKLSALRTEEQVREPTSNQRAASN